MFVTFFLGTFAKFAKSYYWCHHVCTSVRLPAWNDWAPPLDGFFCHLSIFFFEKKNCLENSNFIKI